MHIKKILIIFLFLLTTGKSFATGIIKQQQDVFSIILLPDTQFYTKHSPNIYQEQTQWIVNNKENLNIKYVIHLGDITQNNTAEQWSVASDAHKTLDTADIPYTLTHGTHDMPTLPSNNKKGKKAVRDTTLFNTYFGPQRFEKMNWYAGNMDGTNDNNYGLFSSNNMDFMVMGLEYAPRNESIAWAKSIIEEHKDRRVFIATHCYLDNAPANALKSGTHLNNCATEYSMTGNGGGELWEKLIQMHPNIDMVFSGHVTDSEHQRSKGIAGNTVHEILTNYQEETTTKTAFNKKGKKKSKVLKSGNGWLKILQFSPSQNTVYVSTISVIGKKTFNQTSKYSSNPKDKEHEYSFGYEMNDK